MQIRAKYSYRYAEAMLAHEFPQEMAEIVEAVESVTWQPVLPEPRVRRRAGGRVVAVPATNQNVTNLQFDAAFAARGWEHHPRIVSTSECRLVADFKKGPIRVEVQFRNRPAGTRTSSSSCCPMRQTTSR